MTKRALPTLQLVADAAGVHRSTASRALNASTAHLLSPAVAERIQAASRALGYRRDVMAASLRTRRSLLIGVLVPDIANPVFGPILSGIEAVLAAHGYSALIANASDWRRQVGAVGDLIARRVEGMVFATVQHRDPALAACLDAGIPAVLVNRAEAEARVSAVVSDDAAGMRMAVEHLVALGHVAIGHVAGPAGLSTGALRRFGFAAAMAAAGLPAPVVEAVAFTREAGLPARTAPAAAGAADGDRGRQRSAGAWRIPGAGPAGTELPARRVGGRPQRHAAGRHGAAATHHGAHPAR